jgi:23S rRNA (adenine2503-C2)-methyltransferase
MTAFDLFDDHEPTIFSTLKRCVTHFIRPTSQTPSLVDYDVRELGIELETCGHNPAHATRILRQFYKQNGRLDPASIPVTRELRRHLQDRLLGRRSEILLKTTAADGTIKLLIGFPDGAAVESVLMPSIRNGVAAGCVSSQVGCAMGCDFCASTKRGLERSLDAGEIVEQFLHLKEQAALIGRKLQTLVFMGMGEPLLNFDAVVTAIRRIADPNLGGLGWRQVTVSTVGIVPEIDRLAAEKLNIHLALSLHAPDDATRSRLVPANRRYPVADIMAAARRFEATTGRTPNIEYCIICDVNDSAEQAEMLAALMEGFRAHVNIIPCNAIGAGVSGTNYVAPTRSRILEFIQNLRSRGVVAHIRETRGDDINAACGQLREMAAKKSTQT